MEAKGFFWKACGCTVGHWIEDPHVDVTGRFTVDPVVYYGKAYLDWKKELENDRD